MSRATVSRVIANNGYVSEEKRRLIEKAIADLGYRPNTMARGLRSNRSNILGAVVVEVASPFYAQMVGGIQKGARAAGNSVLVASGYAIQDEEANAIVELIDRACDGLILYLENPLRPDVAKVIRASKTPVVTIGADDPSVATFVIHIDNVAGARDAMRLLLDEGHRAIAHLSGGMMYRDTDARLKGIAQALAERGLGVDDIYVEHGDFAESFGFDATRRLLASGRPVTAIFAGDDDIAAGALLALKAEGKHVPGDISLVGFDDNFHARHLTPSLTTVRQPVDEVGRMAAELLAAHLAGKPPEAREINVRAELVLRDSVGPAAGARSRKETAVLMR